MTRVALMITCLGDTLFPDVGVATVRLLRRLGVTVDFPRAQTCCGQPHFNSGYHDGARELARHTIRAFANGQAVVATDAGCLLNIAGCLRRRRSKVQALHLAQVLEKT